MANALKIPPLFESMDDETDKDIVPAKDNLPVEKKDRSEKETQRQHDIDDDHEFARDSIRHVVSKGKDALDDALEVAVQSQQPRAYEVVSGLIKAIAESSKDMLEIHQRKDALEAMSAFSNDDEKEESPQLIVTADLASLFDGMAKAALDKREREVLDTVDVDVVDSIEEADEFVPPVFSE